jgi:hypothetical protein
MPAMRDRASFMLDVVPSSCRAPKTVTGIAPSRIFLISLWATIVTFSNSWPAIEVESELFCADMFIAVDVSSKIAIFDLMIQ